MNRTVLFGIVLLGLICGVVSHSYVTTPITRGNQKQTNAGCRAPGCLGPCDVPLSSKDKSRESLVAARGDKITVQWPRNNHAGGFIRFAWAPTSQSDLHASFDNNVQQINCHEVGGCRPDDALNPNGGDSGPGDGSSKACTQQLIVPNLADGEWTLQWAWFGGAFALGDYYSCVDYKISGGAPAVSSKLDATFIGGDWTYPGQNKCKFFNTDRLHQCVNEPCNTPFYPGGAELSGPAYLPPNSEAVTPSFTTGKTQVPSTTGKTQVPSTTGMKTEVPSTTGKKTETPSTTGKKTEVPSTTGAIVETPSCTVGHSLCANADSFYTCVYTDSTHTAWGAAQSCAPGTSCEKNPNDNDYILCAAKKGNAKEGLGENSASKMFSNSLWITIVLFSTYLLTL